APAIRRIRADHSRGEHPGGLRPASTRGWFGALLIYRCKIALGGHHEASPPHILAARRRRGRAPDPLARSLGGKLSVAPGARHRPLCAGPPDRHACPPPLPTTLAAPRASDP